MRIGHITYSYKPIIGGQEAYISDLYEVLKKTGHDQRVYQPRNNADDPEIVMLTKFFDFLPGMIAFDLSLLPKRWVLKKEDILIVNYPEIFPAVAWHKKAIVISHGATWTREGARSNDARLRLAKFAWNKAPVFVSNDTFVLREMGVEIAPRSRLFTEIEPRHWFLPNCVDSAMLARSSLPAPWDDSEPVILIPRNLTRNRGVDLAISAFKLIRQELKEGKMVIVGDTITGVTESHAYKADVIKQAADMELDNHISFAGRVDRARMPGYYKAASLTMIPTRSSEGTSLAALESMACGTPVVATAVEGLLDLPVKHAEPVPAALAEAALKVLADRKAFSTRQQAAVSVVYDIQNWRKCWLNIIANVAKG